MKKDSKKIEISYKKEANKSKNVVTAEDLLLLHFKLVRQNSYRTYTSFAKKYAINDFSELLDKLFNKKGEQE